MSKKADYDLSRIGGRVGWALDAADGKSRAGLAKRLGKHSGVISNVISNDRAIRPNGRWDEIADYLGVHIDWLVSGRGPIWIDPLKNDDIDGQFGRVPLEQEFERYPVGDDDGRAFAQGYYVPSIAGAIPELGDQAGAGEGTVGEVYNIQVNGDTISGHRIVAEWKLPDVYLRNELKLSGKETIILPVQGDSMSPTYRDGDRVIVDLRHRDFGDDGVYLITDGFSAPRIKRLEYIFNSAPPAVRIISDNPASKEQASVIEQLNIVGRVAGRISRG